MSTIDLQQYEIWFVSGSQHLYGPEALKEVDVHARKIASFFNDDNRIPTRVIHKKVVTTPSEITALCVEASSSEKCAGLVLWMHTFSPAKMWIAGLSQLTKPFMHLHTQFNRDIPWESIDMDYMNLHQSAHGGREFGFIVSRMNILRKVVVGHWEESTVVEKVGSWARVACSWQDSRSMNVARFGDNMREVAVTEGDKVEAQIVFGYSVNGYGLGDLADTVDSVTPAELGAVIDRYHSDYEIVPELAKGGDRFSDLEYSAKIEAGMRKFLEQGNFKAFTTTFENLHGLNQLPGLAVQSLMKDGYGFGAEGDWKTAALVRTMKVMAEGLDGGTSFMEDYTYHLEPGSMKVLGAHMLEVCPSIADGKPRLEIHPLGIGGKEDPVRMVFNVSGGPGVNATIVNMRGRFRMIINPCTVLSPDADLPKLPVARVVWDPEPNLPTAAEGWILSGGAHHTGFSMAVTTEQLETFAETAGIECVIIDKDTKIRDLKHELMWNAQYYR